MAKVLEFQDQHKFFQWIFRTDFLYVWLIGSPCSPRDSQESSLTPQFKSIHSSVFSFFILQLSHPHMTTRKTIALTRQIFVGKLMSLVFNMLSRLVIAFLPRSKCPNFMAAVTICSDFGAQKNKVSHCFYCFPSICYEVMGPDAMILIIWMLSFKPIFPLFSFTFIESL